MYMNTDLVLQLFYVCTAPLSTCQVYHDDDDEHYCSLTLLSFCLCVAFSVGTKKRRLTLTLDSLV